MENSNSEAPLLRMSRLQFWASFGIALVLFLFAMGPIWRHPGDIGALNVAIFWSYLVIPPLVAGFLVVSRRWSLRAFFLDTLSLTLLKYTVTFSIALALWATVAPPQAAEAAPARPRVAAAPAEPAITPTPIDPDRTGTVRVEVIDSAGRPLAGAAVFVAEGLEAYVFAPPAEPVVLTNDGSGTSPRRAVAMVGQQIVGRSKDGRLHTLVGSTRGEALFNVPLLSSGEPTVVRAGRAEGRVEIGCNVHAHEARTTVLMLAHPFFGTSDDRGEVVLRGVPAGRLRIGVVHAEQGAAEVAVDLGARATASARIVVTR